MSDEKKQTDPALSVKKNPPPQGKAAPFKPDEVKSTPQKKQDPPKQQEEPKEPVKSDESESKKDIPQPNYFPVPEVKEEKKAMLDAVESKSEKIDEDEKKEDLNKEQLDKIIKDPKNLASLIKIILGSPKEVAEAFGRLTDKYSRDEMEEMSNNPLSYLTCLYQADELRESDLQGALVRRLLKEIKDSGEPMPVRSSDKLSDKVSHGKKYGKDKGRYTLRGDEAAAAIIAKTRGLKKIYLYNSGFHVTMKSSGLAELNEFYNSVADEAQEIGRMLGGHFHFMQDLYIKQKFMDILPSLVTNSNLVKWDQSNNLTRNVSIHDYDTLLWAAASMQYRKGIELELVCTNPDCEFIDHNHMVDLNKTRLNRFDIIPAPALDFIVKGEEVKGSELKKYRDELLGFTDTYECNLEDAKVTYKFQVPTMSEYLEYGDILLSQLATAIHGEFSFKNEKARQVTMVNTYKMLRPWIANMVCETEDGIFETEDEKAILESLDVSQQENQSLKDALEKFIKNSKLTYIAYAALKCPKCGKTPADSIDDFRAIDVQQLFFDLCCRRLVLAGMN